MNIYCCSCKADVAARLTSGEEIYPHRGDLHLLPFWKCESCGNYVGCHHKTDSPTNPLGNIPTKEVRNARKHLHKIIDPLWKSKKISRNHLYNKISKECGFKYHTATIRSVEEARVIYKVVQKIRGDLCNQG